MNKIIIISAALFLFSCDSIYSKKEYQKGPPIIVKKEQSLLPGISMYTYEGYGREEEFEDKTDKYNVGDTLRGKSK
jgi:hypothetical protein